MATAKAAIGSHGDGLAAELMAHCELCLQSAPNTREADVIRQSIVVLMGTLAKHMDKQNPKVQGTGGVSYGTGSSFGGIHMSTFVCVCV